MRRMGFPLLGGFGLGGLLGSPLTSRLGYLLRRNSASQAQYQAYQSYPAAGTNDDLLEKLRLLSEVRDRGVLTDNEFENEKRRLLNR